jgi:hypothetical protein
MYYLFKGLLLLLLLCLCCNTLGNRRQKMVLDFANSFGIR